MSDTYELDEALAVLTNALDELSSRMDRHAYVELLHLMFDDLKERVRMAS